MGEGGRSGEWTTVGELAIRACGVSSIGADEGNRKRATGQGLEEDETDQSRRRTHRLRRRAMGARTARFARSSGAARRARV